MVKDLTDEKQRIMNEHFTKMLDTNKIILKQVDDAMRNYQVEGKGDLTFFDKIKAAFKFERTKVLNVPPEEMLKYSKNWFDVAKQNFNTIIQSSGVDHTDLQKNIDKQIEIAQSELAQIEKELDEVNDEPKKTWLQRKKDEIIDRSW